MPTACLGHGYYDCACSRVFLQGNQALHLKLLFIDVVIPANTAKLEPLIAYYPPRKITYMARRGSSAIRHVKAGETGARMIILCHFKITAGLCSSGPGGAGSVLLLWNRHPTPSNPVPVRTTKEHSQQPPCPLLYWPATILK